MSKSQSQLKTEVAKHISAKLSDHDLILLGSGSTVNAVIQASAAGRRFVSSSKLTSSTITDYNHQEVTLDSVHSLPDLVCVDGADQILENGKIIIKGHGGALVREKITWQAADQILVAVDETKLAEQLDVTIPIAVIPYGIESVRAKVLELSQIKGAEVLHFNNLPYNTDDGNMIIHLDVDATCDLKEMDQLLHAIAGVVDTGIFLRDQFKELSIICATQNGIREF